MGELKPKDIKNAINGILKIWVELRKDWEEGKEGLKEEVEKVFAERDRKFLCPVLESIDKVTKKAIYFKPEVSSIQRKIIHQVADQHYLFHQSFGSDEKRFVLVSCSLPDAHAALEEIGFEYGNEVAMSHWYENIPKPQQEYGFADKIDNFRTEAVPHSNRKAIDELLSYLQDVNDDLIQPSSDQDCWQWVHSAKVEKGDEIPVKIVTEEIEEIDLVDFALGGEEEKPEEKEGGNEEKKDKKPEEQKEEKKEEKKEERKPQPQQKKGKGKKGKGKWKGKGGGGGGEKKSAEELVKGLEEHMRHNNCKLVDDEKSFEEALEVLSKCSVLAVDCEWQSVRSYFGLTCLIQISSIDTDFLIDPLKLWNSIPKLDSIFSNEKIVKVLHNATGDCNTLHRDFGISFVNIFDTQEAANQLKMRLALVDVLCKYSEFPQEIGEQCKETVSVCDWRVRPLSPLQRAYAMCDTHFLVPIYYEMSKEVGPLIYETLFNSNKRVLSSLFDPKKALQPIEKDSLLKTLKDPKQREILLIALAWRENVAKKEDESRMFICPSSTLANLVKFPPNSAKDFHLLCCHVPSPSFLEAAPKLVEEIKEYLEKEEKEKEEKEEEKEKEKEEKEEK